MNNWLVKTKDKGKSALNVIKSAGPFLISQAEEASEAYIRQKAKSATVDIGKELILDEAKMLNEVRKELLLRHSESDPGDRLRIKRDLEYIEHSLRQLKIGQKALSYLDESTEERQSDEPIEEISPHWMDKFNELARARNEDWREELLAKALAKEAAAPGSVSPRVLWIIGTLEEEIFHTFACFLDLCSFLATGLMIPRAREDIMKKPIPNCPVGANTQIGNITYMLEDIGVLADPISTAKTIQKQTKFFAHYFKNNYLITCKDKPLQIFGDIPTGIGEAIADFYERKYNELGEEIFQAWVDSLDKNNFDIIKVPEPVKP
jgi:hypothetical protein